MLSQSETALEEAKARVSEANARRERQAWQAQAAAEARVLEAKRRQAEIERCLKTLHAQVIIM